MKVGLILPMFSGDAGRVLAFARRAEALGFDGVFGFDHFFPPGAGPDRPSLEAFATLAAVGAVTDRVTVGTLVTRARLRSAGMLAKLATTLDEISGERFVLGIGSGDPLDRAEHEAFGFPVLGVTERRAHLAETVAAVQALFRGESWGGGDHIPPLTGPLLPPPRRPYGPPVWVGGLADDVVRLAGTLADGWNGWGLEPAAFAPKVRLLAAEAGRAGRTAEATWAGIVLVGEDDRRARDLLEARRARGMPTDEIWWGSAEALRGFLSELSAADASWVAFVPAGPADRMELIAGEVLPAVRSR